MSKKNQTAETVVESTIVTEEVKNVPWAKDGSQAKTCIETFGGVSKAIRGLVALGYSRGEVAKTLDKRYQHVRNVLITPVKKQS
jgi:Holliday junction resolvasome RuvABC DNA-binding subunit